MADLELLTIKLQQMTIERTNDNKSTNTAITYSECCVPCFISTYGLKNDWSYKGEKFKNIALTWKLGVSRIEALKIRIANWKPKYDRSNQAIFYFDVKTEKEANEILEKFEKFNFKKLEKRFDDLFEKDSVRIKNTGDTNKWLLKIIPVLRSEFS